MAAVKVCVRNEGSQKVLLHEIYYDAKTYECLIFETYCNEQAMLQYLDLAGPLQAESNVN